MDNIKQFFPAFQNELIAEIQKNATLAQVESGKVLLRSGEYIKYTSLVVKGKIKIMRQDDEGGEFFMYYLQPGQACAISMICAAKNEKSEIVAKAVEDSEIVMVPLHLMDKWMIEYKSWSNFVLETYKNRFDEILAVVDNIAFRAMDERLEFYLKREKDACGCNEFNLSHQEIANDLNTSREVVSRLLKKMEQRELIRMNRGSIILLDKFIS